MQGLGNTKNEIARRRMREDGVDVDEGSVRFVRTGWGSTPGLARLAFGLLAAGRTLRMEISHTKAAYTLGEASRCRSSAKDNLSRPLPLHQAETVDCLARHLVGVLSPDLLASVRVFLIPGRPDEVLQTDIAERMLPPMSSGAQVQLYLSVPTSRATDSSWTATSHPQKLPVKGLGAVEFGHGHDGRCQLQRMPSALTGMNPVIWNGLPGLARLSAGASTVWPASSTMKW